MAEAAFDRWVVLDLFESYREQDIDEMAFAIGKITHAMRTGRFEMASVQQA